MDKKIFVSITVFLSVLISGSFLYSQEIKKRSLTVTNIVGSAKIQYSGKDLWEPLLPGKKSVISEGDTLIIQPNSSVELLAEDNTKIKLDQGSIFSIEKFSLDESSTNKISQFRLWTGKVSFIVPPISEFDVFEVETPHSLCTIRGTEFSIEVSDKNETIVQVQSGAVGVKNIKEIGGGKEVIVRTGEQTVVKPFSVPEKPSPIPQPQPIQLQETQQKETLSQQKTQPTSAKPAATPTTTTADIPLPTQPMTSTGRTSLVPGLTMNGSFGTVVLAEPDGTKKVYTQISVRPELSIWKIGIGLDLYVYLDENNKARLEDWTGIDSLVKKIWYVRYGQKGELLYAYVGGFAGVTLKQGLIMNRYSNMIQYPNVRKVGVELDLDLGRLGIETIVPDINDATLLGGRFFVRPLYGLPIPIIKNLALGISGVTDQNIDSNKDTTIDQMNVYGADVDLPILSGQMFSMTAFANVAKMGLGQAYLDAKLKDGGVGTSGGFYGSIIKLITYRAEYRKMENSFVPNYFGPFYDVERANKPYLALIPDTVEQKFKEGPYGELSVSLLNLVSVTLTYENYSEDPQNVYPYVHGELQVNPAILFNKFTFSASYDKRNAETWDDLKNVKGQNSIITTEIGYPLSPNIFFVITTRQAFDAKGNPIESNSFQIKAMF